MNTHVNTGETGGGQVKQYSWDKLRVELDLSQYIVDAENNTEVIRKPGNLVSCLSFYQSKENDFENDMK